MKERLAGLDPPEESPGGTLIVLHVNGTRGIIVAGVGY
jgi:hypothetical protein